MQLCWWWALAAWANGGVVVLPGSSAEVVFERDTSAVVEGALTDLQGGHFVDAAEQLQALADASSGAQLRYLEAVAWYEAGELRLAERAAELGRRADPDLGPLNSLWGLILLDLGRGGDAVAPLEDAVRAGRASGDARLEAGAHINLGLLSLDQGHVDAAVARFNQARQLAEARGLADLEQRARENLAVAAELSGTGGGGGELGKVADSLRRGDTKEAEQTLSAPSPSDRRGRVQRALAEAELSRARGDLEGAAQQLHRALAQAREGGLLRETAAALAGLGVLYRLGGQYEIAHDELQEAVGLVAGTSLRVSEVTYRVQAGMVAVRMEALAEARAQLTAARRAQGDDGPRLGKVRLDELEGAIAAAAGDVAGASAATQRALQAREELGHAADAARLSASLVQLYAGREPRMATRWRQRALQSFSTAGDALGEAHVGISAGLGLVEAGDIEGAVKAFVGAAEYAEGLDGDRARQVARIARDNAAQALLMTGLGAARAETLGLGDAVQAHQRFTRAESDYQAALAAYDAGDYPTARVRFQAAFEAFEALEEDGYALKARRGRAWSSWNQAVAMAPAQAYPTFYELIQEAQRVEDPELHARAQVAAALAAQEVGVGDAQKQLRAGAKAAEQAGLAELAGQCWAATADLDLPLESRAGAARRALQVLGNEDQTAVYAAYSVAVDAYNAEELDLAYALAVDIAPGAGALGDAVQGVIDAVEESR